MARPKDDADRLKQNRDTRRELLESIPSDFPEDFDELEEKTSPAIHINVHAAPKSPAPPPGSPQASTAPLPPPRAKQISEAALETLPKPHRLWALLALLAAALAAYAISKGLLG